MKRLTAEECSAFLKCYHPCGDNGLCIRCDRLIAAISELAEYKNTGLAPDEVEGLAQAKRDKQLVELVEYPQNMKDLLEPLKIQSALRSCLMVLEFRKEHEPDKISILDYTIIAALHKAFQEAEAALKRDCKDEK